MGFYPSIPMNFRPLPWHLLNGPSLCSAVVGGSSATLAVVATVVTFAPSSTTGKKVSQISRSNFWHLNPRLKCYKNNMHLKNTLLQKSIQVYLYHLLDSHFTNPVEIMFVGRFPKTRFGPRFFMVGFLGRLWPWDSAGETFSGVLHHFCWRDIQYPLNFQGVFPRCIILHIHIWCIYLSIYIYI